MLLNDHPAHLDSASLSYFGERSLRQLSDDFMLAVTVNSFTETDKLIYRGHDDDSKCVWLRKCSRVTNLSYAGTMFHFTCFNREDPHDPSVGLMNGQLCIPGKLLREIVFDPVISQVCFSKYAIFSILINTVGSRFDRGTNTKDESANSCAFPCRRCWEWVPETAYQGTPTVASWGARWAVFRPSLGRRSQSLRGHLTQAQRR